MDHSIKTGLCFGLTSGIITTLGLMVGLHSGTHSKVVVLGGILTIAVADAFSDALGIHISEEAENQHTLREIWAATISTFLSKFIFASTFIVPVILFDLSTAMIVAIVWGLSVLSILSFIIARDQKEKALGVIAEHLMIAIVVIFATHYLGEIIPSIFA